PPDARAAASAPGNSGGAPRAPQAVIASAGAAAAARGAELGVAVFEPHPRRFFQPDAAPFRLQSPRQRARALGELGVAEVFEIGFDADLSALSDRGFAEQILRDLLGIVHVSIGADFRFGSGRCGDAASLRRLGVELGFTVDAVAPVGGDAKISSTGIRAAVAAGEMAQAAALLGRPWAIEGEVRRGFARGAGFGFPTANVGLDDYVRPRLGVYAVR